MIDISTDSHEIRHATTVALCGVAVMIEGPSGSGKSALGLELMAYGADLVADDRTLLQGDGDQVLASAPPTLPARIEARGVGLLPARLAGPTPLCLVVRMDKVETARLPEPVTTCVLGRNVTLIGKCETGHFGAALMQYIRGHHESLQ
ncbi:MULTISPECIES: HPr kinase/phosphorylase [unclassified Meridianimarinicoccus]|uniref:HPr kinase/phosphorylase n=1 Tax=unclassified Meridianimarinicoccus TaxID=2923344 RepID=UPI001867C9F4|nr:serine kinase [Fluviibacterium sp. MJW13]